MGWVKPGHIQSHQWTIKESSVLVIWLAICLWTGANQLSNQVFIKGKPDETIKSKIND